MNDTNLILLLALVFAWQAVRPKSSSQTAGPAPQTQTYKPMTDAEMTQWVDTWQREHSSMIDKTLDRVRGGF